MAPDLNDEIELARLLEAALDLPPDRWRPFLEERASRRELARSAEELLRREAELSGFLAESPVPSPFGSPDPASETAPERELPPTVSGRRRATSPFEAFISKAPTTAESDEPERIGPYRIVEELGSGGMGMVYLAEQEEPVRRQVALKVIKQGMDTRQVVTRFEAERQALAMMDHPAIARVYSAGATPRGRPYFAMELVRGEPITKHCDRQRLTVRQRLELFVEVCDAVQHAHHKAVIHRDLKPSNVLVAVSDDPSSPRRVTPKVIDFGIAKATAEKLTEASFQTQLGAVIGTPAYMSPEQAEGRVEDVDTRSDVYALGAILYELLVGTPPLDPAELRRGGLDTLARRIRESEAPRLSSRLSTLDDEASTETATLRGSEPRALHRELKGDLEWITLKALAKERRRRYGSPRELAADVERYLADEPILARPPSTAYQARKLVQRHRGAVAAAALFLVLLIAFAVSMAVQARRVAAEAARAEQEAEAKGQVSEFLQSLFSVSDPSEARGESVTARELLERGAERIDEELVDQPRLQAEMMHTIGVVYGELGLYPRAEPLLTRARELRAELLGREHRDALTSALELASLYNRQARYDEAEQLSREALEICQRILDDDHPLKSRALTLLASALSGQGRYDEAERLERQVLEVRRRTLGEDHPDTLSILLALAATTTLKGQIAEAEKLERQVLQTRRRTLGADHPDTLHAISNLADSLNIQGRFDDAEVLIREALESRKRVLGEEHPETLSTLRVLANILVNQGDLATAEKLERQILEIRRRVLGDDHVETLMTMNNLANSLRLQGRMAEAEILFRELLDRRQRVLREDHPGNLLSQRNLALVVWDLGRHVEAETLFRQVLDDSRRLLGEAHPDTVTTALLNGVFYRDLGRYTDAETLQRQTVEVAQRDLGEDSVETPRAQYELARTLVILGRYQEAESPLLESLHGRQRLLGSEHPETLDSAALLGDFYARTGRHAEAREQLEAALEARRQPLGWTEISLADVHYSLAALEVAVGDRAAALDQLRQAVDLGFADARIRTDPLLVPLRDTPELEALVAEVEKRL